MNEVPHAIAMKMRRWKDDPVYFVRTELKAEPDPSQIELLDAFADPTIQRIGLKAPICLDAVTPTPDGVMRWGDVQVGSRLFAEDGSIIRVVHRFDVGVVPLYRVAFGDGSSLRVSSDHEWDIQTRYDRAISKRRTVSTGQLMAIALRRRSGQRTISIPLHLAVDMIGAALPADPYVFGLWLGDGIAHEPRLIAPDRAVRDAIVLRGQPITESQAVPKRIGLSGFISALRETGMITCRSYEKYIPDLYKFSSSKQRLLLLQGLMDADGTCAKNGHTYLATSSEKLVDDVVWLARSLGYVSRKMGPYRINGGINRDSFRASMVGPTCPFLADTSKRRRWKIPKRGKASRFIESIVPDGSGPAMCVEVDHPSHCFLATDFLVTHNCKGPGKTAGLVWCNLNFIATRKFPKMVACSISWDNLMENFWTELAKWYGNSTYLKAKFKWTQTSFYSIDHPDTWWLSPRSWARTADSTQQAKTLAGCHAENTLVSLDESGGMFQSVEDAAEGTLATVGGEHRILQAGNPTTLEGPLYKADTIDRHIWKMISITGDPDSPKRSPRVSITWARQQIASYGRDHDWCKVNVFGEFPSGSFNRFLSPDDVQKSMSRSLHETLYNHQAKILGVDPGRFGGDRTVLFPRQGLAGFMPVVLRPNRSEKNWTGNVAARICQAFEKWGIDACFIDDSGAWGSGILDAVRDAGWNILGVQFGGTALDSRYKNRRCEMHMLASEWVKNGGCLPFMPEIQREATTSEYWFTGSKFVMEEKDQVKIKLNGDSPDLWDAFVLTFAQPVAPRTGLDWLDRKTTHARIDPEEDLVFRRQRAMMEED